MKKIIFGMAAIAILFTGCNNDQDEIADDQAKIDMSDFFVHTDDTENGSVTGKTATQSHTCASMQVLNKQLAENPKLYQQMYDVEYATRKFILGKKPAGAGNGNGNGGNDGDGGTDPIDDGLGVINIPVYVHVVYSNSNENISTAQVQSQINVLNADFRLANSDVNQVPTEFAGNITDSEIEFSLAGTFRHSSTTTSWGTNNTVKNAYPPVTPSTHLNIWVCNIGGGILGYAQFPGGSSSTDGIVVSPQYFGNTGYVAAPFDKGRTMTHEVGHYFNLRHIWGDGRCNRDDFVSDTPTSDAPNYSCPSYPTVNCRSNDMTMNYMDYVDDACMYMFSKGQKQRMRAIFASGGSRESMLN